MPGKINCIRVNNFITGTWNTSYTKFTSYVYVEGLNKDDSYIAIFSRYQKDSLESLKESDLVNILWISDLAVNPVHKDNGPSNTVVIFEVK